MRKLATIREVTDVCRHENADALELVYIDGWQVVSKLGDFKKGDTVIYFEIDSVLPLHEHFEFLRKSSFVSNSNFNGFRLKTIKLRKEISQGLVVSLDVLKDFCDNQTFEKLLSEFQENGIADVTDVIGVRKWEREYSLKGGAVTRGNAKGNFPVDLVPKTDQERIQNLSNEKMWKKLHGYYEITEKLDGSSMTVIVPSRERKDSETEDNIVDIRVCSRNLELKEENENTFWKAARLVFDNVFFDNDYAFQGELVGPGIQGNYYRLNEHRFYIYDIFDIDEQRYLSTSERQNLFVKLVDMSPNKDLVFHVPILSTEFFLQTIKDDSSSEPCVPKQILDLAESVKSTMVDLPAEGIVFKKVDGFSIYNVSSFKAISNKWLLKNEN
jgi:RNA ligase (TIGR02306 family)